MIFKVDLQITEQHINSDKAFYISVVELTQSGKVRLCLTSMHREVKSLYI